MRHIIPISGKDSLATALIQTTRYPNRSYEFIFNDVGTELPETYQWLENIEKKTGWIIQRTGKDLRQIISLRGNYLPSLHARYCTREGKLIPMERFIGGYLTTVYFGLRADEDRIGYSSLEKKNIISSYPLRDMGIDLRGVYSILEAQNLMPPDFFWQHLFDLVNPRAVMINQNWYEELTKTEKIILFSGRSRANCFFCFFQREYEWVWLYETHNDLFMEASSFEKEKYTWRQGLRLEDLCLEEKRNEILSARANKIVNYIYKRNDENRILEVDTEIALISCGLFCGK